MYIYVLLIHDWEENEHYIIGSYSSRRIAIKMMEMEMATVHGLNEFTDWDFDDIAGNWCFFYDHFTCEIQRTLLDEIDES